MSITITSKNNLVPTILSSIYTDLTGDHNVRRRKAKKNSPPVNPPPTPNDTSIDIDDENLTSNNSSTGLSESVLNSSRHNSFNDSIVSSKRTSEISTASPNFRFNKFNLSPRYR